MVREFRLRQMLDRHAASLKNNWSALEQEIHGAHEKVTRRKRKTPIVRRTKLKDIVDGTKDVSLRISELEALDDYLTIHHQGLAFVPIFARTELLPTIVSQGHVDFLVGMRETTANQDQLGTIVVSQFDLRAQAELVQLINMHGAKTTFGIHMILLRSSREAAQGITDEAWQDVLARGKVVVSIASPIANHATERMLAAMFGIAPHESPERRTSRPDLAFVLPDANVETVFSSFVEGPASLPAGEARKVRNRCWALRVGNDVRVAGPEDKQHSSTYAVIVGQRRADGHVWVVAAGLHGAGTYAAALAIPAVDMTLSPGRPGEHGPVHVQVVEADVTYTTSPSGTKIRAVSNPRILTQMSRTFEVRPVGPFGPAPRRPEPAERS